MTEAALRADMRALLTRGAAQAGDAAFSQWLAMWGMTDPSHARTRRHEHDEQPIPDAPHSRPDPETLLINAYRTYCARRTLMARGSITVAAVAAAQRCHPSTARRRVARACERRELFTVRVGSQIHIPAVLLDAACRPQPQWQPVIAALADAGMSDWAKWRWITGPNSGLSGDTAAETIDTDPQRVLAAARRRAARTAQQSRPDAAQPHSGIASPSMDV